MSERRGAHTSERENNYRRSSLYLWVLLFLLVLILSLRKLRGFLLYDFLEEIFLCILSLMIIVVHVILSDKILRSYCLNDKNLTVQLATSTKRKVSELVRDFDVDMNDFPAKIDLNILPIGSYDVLISMDWLEQHHLILNSLNKYSCAWIAKGIKQKIKAYSKWFLLDRHLPYM